jgi:hypothetical protein
LRQLRHPNVISFRWVDWFVSIITYTFAAVYALRVRAIVL